MNIDVHVPTVIPAALGLAAGNAADEEDRRVENATFGGEAVRVNQAQLARIGPLLTQLDARFAAMDRMSVDVQLVSPSPVHYDDWAEPALARRISRTVNEGVASMLSERVLGLGVVRLQHAELAIEELTEAMEMGLRGVEISTSAGDRELADPSLEPFWARGEELGAIVFIHRWGCSLGERVNGHYLGTVVGQPVETTLALSHLICSGLLDRRVVAR